MEQVHYFGGWVEGVKSLAAKTLQTDKHKGLAAPDAKKWAPKCLIPDR